MKSKTRRREEVWSSASTTRGGAAHRCHCWAAGSGSQWQLELLPFTEVSEVNTRKKEPPKLPWLFDGTVTTNDSEHELACYISPKQRAEQYWHFSFVKAEELNSQTWSVPTLHTHSDEPHGSEMLKEPLFLIWEKSFVTTPIFTARCLFADSADARFIWLIYTTNRSNRSCVCACVCVEVHVYSLSVKE